MSHRHNYQLVLECLGSMRPLKYGDVTGLSRIQIFRVVEELMVFENIKLIIPGGSEKTKKGRHNAKEWIKAVQIWSFVEVLMRESHYVNYLYVSHMKIPNLDCNWDPMYEVCNFVRCNVLRLTILLVNNRYY